MTIKDKIKDEKLRNNINREAVKISTLSSEKKWQIWIFHSQEILPSDQRRVIEEAKFT